MLKKTLIVMIFIIFSFLLFGMSGSAAAKNKKNKVILSTVGIIEDYEILGIVSYRSNEIEIEKINEALRNKAEKIGADYVIGIQYFSGAGYLYGTGTAVKLKTQEGQ